jgi:hypothetical protein
MAEYYRRGTLSLQEAATAARVSIYEMLDYVEREKIRPPIESPQEIEREFNHAQRLLKELDT